MSSRPTTPSDPTTLPQTSSAAPPLQPFTPLFTLISTASSTSQTLSPDYHHPTTHYIFSSDSPDSYLLTSAALSSFPASSDNPPTPHPNERYLILDLDATGSKVVKASSMSPDWQITSAEILPAPTWEGEEGGGRGMMLRVEGIEVGQEGEGKGTGEEGAEGMEVLMERFERRMGELRRVVEGGGAK